MKIGFLLLQNAWKHIRYNKFNSIVLVIALTIGLVFPLIAINDVNDLIRDGQVSRYEDADRITVIDYWMNYKNEDDIRTVINAGAESGLFEYAGYCVSNSEIFYYENESYAGGISGISKEYLTINSYELLEGEVFADNDYLEGNEYVCLLQNQSVLVRNGVGVGDTIEILGNKYKVKGIIRAPRVQGGVLIPYAMVADLFSGMNGWVQYQVVTYGERIRTPRLLALELFEVLDGEIIMAKSGNEQEEEYYHSIWEVNRYRIFRAVIVVAFAILNILILLWGMIIKDRYSIAVRLALGANWRMVYLEVLIRNFMLMLIAFCTSVLLYPVISGLIRGTNRYLQILTVFEVGIGGVGIIVILTYILLRMGFVKKDIATLLKK